jgi:DNA-directed RNA polymerase subunit M
LVCPRPGCGYQEQVSKVETVVSSESQTQEVVRILEKEVKELKPMPITKVLCPKCGHTKAYFWLVQTRGTDESPSQFFRCVRCNNTWREYS